jgi:hypothetical protein
MAKKHLVLVFCIACLFSLCAPTSHACSCVTPEVPQALREARAVFVGEVIEIVEPHTDNPKAALSDRLYAIKFKVERSWKGATSREIIILSDQGRAGCFSWGPFLKGERYLVYAERRAPSGAPIRNLAVLFSCNRTALLASASEDLKTLETIRPRLVSLRQSRSGPTVIPKSLPATNATTKPDSTSRKLDTAPAH